MERCRAFLEKEVEMEIEKSWLFDVSDKDSIGALERCFIICTTSKSLFSFSDEIAIKIAKIFEKEEVEAVVAYTDEDIFVHDECMVLSEYVAFFLGENAPAVFTEKENEKLVIKKDYEQIISGKRVLVFQDSINIEKPDQEILELLASIGCDVIGFGIIVDYEKVSIEKLFTKSLKTFF